jgi:hypothetical protein
MGNLQGRDCSIALKTANREAALLYSEETIREKMILLREEASVEGDGYCRALRVSGGVTGCVVTPLTLETAPLLFCLAMGGEEEPVYVSETRNLYSRRLRLLPTEDSIRFAVEQDRGGSRKRYEGCVVVGFELRALRGQAIKLKLDIRGEQASVARPDQDAVFLKREERFMGDRVVCRINGAEYRNIYGFTLTARKEGGTKTKLWIRRAVERGSDLPEFIEELTIGAELLRDEYECRRRGMFRLRLSRLALESDETTVDCADGVIGPLRYYCAGGVSAETFTNEK